LTDATSNEELEAKFFHEFAIEAKLMSNLRHPNIVMFMGVIIESDFIGLVTEYCAEGNVNSVLMDAANEQALGVHIISRMLVDTCRGMSFLHLHNPPIIHKDLKGQNILVDDNWHCKVADFGLYVAREKARKASEAR
jgi:Janus kinase 2